MTWTVRITVTGGKKRAGCSLVLTILGWGGWYYSQDDTQRKPHSESYAALFF